MARSYELVCPRVFRPALARWPQWVMIGAVALGLAITAQASVPAYLRAAMDEFNPEVPAGWAYTQMTVRNDLTIEERFEPARPPPERWTLLRFNGQEPTVKDREKYRQFKEADPATSSQAAFQKEDIEPGSITLVREDSAKGVFRCRFRAGATGSNKMLGHLSLLLIVNKQGPYIEKFLLELTEPYSPVLGVKMNSLAVKMDYSAPTPEQPSLPAVSSTRYFGRIFFIGTEENLRVSYSAFTRAR
jgi:hypothetical protein